MSLITAIRPALRPRSLNLDLNKFWKTRPSTRASGFRARISERARANKHGQMDQCTKAGGRKTKPMERDDSFTPTAMFMTVHGLMTRLMDMAFIAI